MAQSLSERFFDPLVNNDAVAGPVLLVARIFMSGAFLVFGVGKIIHMARMQDYMEAHGVPGDLIPIDTLNRNSCRLLFQNVALLVMMPARGTRLDYNRV